MTPQQELAAAGLAAIGGSWFLTALVRSYALRTQLLDVPNERSSHTVPTPRGGGMAIVLTCLACLAALGWTGRLESRLVLAGLGAGSLVALLGYLDDRSPLPARWRFLGHGAAVVWVVALMGPIPSVPVLGVMLDLNVMGPVLCWIFAVWMINLFNFMDGIDGIAGVQTVCAAVGGAALWWAVGSGTGWLAALALAAATAGFLVWNFPPAKIFMGDAGSGFLGLMMALLALWSAQAQPVLLYCWFILVGVFMVDATTTLVRRVRRGERFFEAHRAHAYQYASRRLGGHRPVTLACLAINLLWLWPWAALVAWGWVDGIVGLALAYAPLIWLVFHFHAGDRAAQARPIA